MGSEYENTAVDSIDFSSLSNEQLQDIVDNDDRSTAQDKARSELDSRNGGTPDEDAAEVKDVTDADLGFGDKVLDMSPSDPMDRAEALGLNTDGINLDPDAGQVQSQAYANAVAESGTVPPTGSPPDDSLTVERVVEQAAAEKQAREEAQEESIEA